ncbi:MAG: xanthine dehydrogenase accessory protein XdhC [Gammaproteobacteria bacterium]|nr:xanthine dehydrogenase accessory protein XdhC [Gammaproteobacteria bacterium]
MDWVQSIARHSSENQGFVLITVLNVTGSGPREAGAKMVVTDDEAFDTIGGGNLEYQAIAKARNLLDQGERTVFSESFSLGKDLTQCCGGSVELLFECMPACKVQIALFGAGHVGSCLSRILSELPYRVSWLDNRESLVSEICDQGLPANLDIQCFSQPEAAVEKLPRNSIFLILTHSHELDMELVEAVISRGDARFCGLIGSKSKAGKFRGRLRRKGFTNEEIESLACPVGLPNVGGKKPMEVAVSIAAQVIGLAHEIEVENHRDSAASPHKEAMAI